MSLLLDALNRAQRNKSFEEENDKNPDTENVDENNIKEKTKEEKSSELSLSPGVDMEGLELDEPESEESVEADVVSIGKADEISNDGLELSILAVEEEKEVDGIENSISPELNTNLKVVAIVPDLDEANAGENEIKDESEDELYELDLEGLDLDREKVEQVESEVVEEPKKFDTLSLAEINKETSVEHSKFEEPEIIAPSSLPIDNIETTSIASIESEQDQPSLDAGKEISLDNTLTNDIEADNNSLTQDNINDVEAENTKPSNTGQLDTDTKKNKTENKKTDNPVDRDGHIKTLLEAKKRKKVIISTVSAVLISATISISGFYYYVSQINEIDNNVSQFEGRSLTPAGALPLEEIAKKQELEGSVENTEVVQSNSSINRNEVVENITIPKKFVIDFNENKTIKTKPKRSVKLKSNRATKKTKKSIKRNIKPKKTVKRIETKESPVHALLISGFEAFQSGDYTEAKSKYQRVLGLEKNNRDALLGSAAIAIRQKNLDLAKNYYTKLLERDQNDSVARAALVGLVGQLDPIKAETELKLMLKNKPGAGYLHFALGNTYAQQHRWLEAQNSFLNASLIDERNPDYAYNIAVSYDHLGEVDAAIKYYVQALNYSTDKKVSFESSQVKNRVDSLRSFLSREVK